MSCGRRSLGSRLSRPISRSAAKRPISRVGVRTVVLNASHTVLPLAFGGVGAALGMTPVFLTMSAALAAGGFFSDRRRRALAAE